MMTQRIAYLSMDNLDGFVSDDQDTFDLARVAGLKIDTVSWRSQTDWAHYDAVVVRTPWDYYKDLPAFLATLRTITACTRLFNDYELMAWNAEKTYLQELERSGIRIVPTRWLVSPSAQQLKHTVDDILIQHGVEQAIVKPTVSAGAWHTHWIRADEGADYAALSDVYCDKTAMVQPFIGDVIDTGETSVFFFNGAFSHAVLKTPKRGDFRVQEEFGSTLSAVMPDAELRALAEQVMGYVCERFEVPLYARIDCVCLSDGSYALMEAELIEPALYFRLSNGGAQRFVDALVSRL